MTGYLFDPRPTLERDPGFTTRPPKHDGPGLEERDQKRLNTLQGRVWTLMRDGAWRTLLEIQAVVGGSEASVSARLRDLRKPAWVKVYGECEVQKRRRTEGLWEYRVVSR